MVFLVCLAIATVFWFLNALNKQYTVDLSFPVKYTNLPKNKILANSPPDHFTLKVNSGGFTILRHKLSMAFSPLIFNVNEFTNQRIEQSQGANFRYATRQYIRRFSTQVSNELQILEIQPDSVYFDFDRVVERKVKVQPDVTYSLKKQYFLNGEITTDPDSVTVSGPESVLDTLQYIATKKQHYKELDKSTQRNVLLTDYENLKISPKRIILKIPLEEYTQKQVLVPIVVKDVPENVSVKLFPDKAKINFMVSLSRFAEVTAKDFVLSVSYNDIVNKPDMLKVEIDQKPRYVISVSFSPDQIEYLIENKSND